MKTVLSASKAAEDLLEKIGSPLHYKEITKLILHKCALNGKTPHETVRSHLGTNPKFIRVAEGVYGLSKWKKYKPLKTVKEITYDILRKKNEPMSLDVLAKKVLEERKLTGHLKTIIKNSIRNDRRFLINESNGYISLTEWL